MENKGAMDWGLLKGSIILFCTCIVICGVLIGASYYFNNDLEKQLKRNRGVFQSISRRYLDVDQEEKLLLDNYPKFVALYESGIIGREKRLNWIEALRQSGEKLNLPSLRYAIKSQETFTPGFQINYGGFVLYRSSMDLTLGLLHEGDLFELLNYINRNADGAYTITECKFSPVGKNIIYDKDQANISASCLLHWITIDLPGGNRIEI
jgi:hypothetical protein